MAIKEHTIETANDVLRSRDLDSFLKIISINADKTVTIVDKQYGQYIADMKSLCPKGTFPLHRLRKKQDNLEKAKKKYEGKQLKGLEIVSLFLAQERGYKSRGYYVDVKAECGHIVTASMSHLNNYRDKIVCYICRNIKHGDRAKLNGIRKTRTPTYNYWQRNKSKLPLKYQDFSSFRSEVGEKLYKHAELKEVDGKFIWIGTKIENDDVEVNLMATALRQAFRHSSFYKNAIEAARVETAEGTFYRCAMCNKLAKRSYIQVDHIDPVSPLDGTPLKREDIITRVWTDKIQILDRKCHTKKSSEENLLRKTNRAVKIKPAA